MFSTPLFLFVLLAMNLLSHEKSVCVHLVGCDMRNCITQGTIPITSASQVCLLHYTWLCVCAIGAQKCLISSFLYFCKCGWKFFCIFIDMFCRFVFNYLLFLAAYQCLYKINYYLFIQVLFIILFSTFYLVYSLVWVISLLCIVLIKGSCNTCSLAKHS